MSYKILIAGVGNLGSHYLQGLGGYGVELDINVQDISEHALKTARRRWNEAAEPIHPHTISVNQIPGDIPQFIDLAIVATNADVRAKVVRKIASQYNVRYWVLEKVLTQNVNGLDELLRLTARSEGSWVNTSRRMMPWYRQLREVLQKGQPLRVYGGDSFWGLACNSVHFLDLVSWWTGEELVSLDGSELDSKWYESKRPGFFEVTGILKATFSGGSELVLESRTGGEALRLLVETEEGEWLIDEAEGIATGPGGSVIRGRLENQSEMTGRLVKAIQETGRCELPTLAESCRIHRIFLKAILNHWNISNVRHDNLVPIT